MLFLKLVKDRDPKRTTIQNTAFLALTVCTVSATVLLNWLFFILASLLFYCTLLYECTYSRTYCTMYNAYYNYFSFSIHYTVGCVETIYSVYQQSLTLTVPIFFHTSVLKPRHCGQWTVDRRLCIQTCPSNHGHGQCLKLSGYPGQCIHIFTAILDTVGIGNVHELFLAVLDSEYKFTQQSFDSK